MNTWFECKIRYDKLDESGLLKKVTEPYLVDALSFTEAEARICKEIEPYISGEFMVANIKRANISELIKDPVGDKWYRARVVFIIVDQEKGIEKKTATNVYVQASDIKGALDNIIENMKGTISDYTITSITETMIMDVYSYVPAEEINRKIA